MMASLSKLICTSLEVQGSWKYVSVIIWFQVQFEINLHVLSKFFKKLKLHEPLWQVQFQVLKNSQG